MLHGPSPTDLFRQEERDAARAAIMRASERAYAKALAFGEHRVAAMHKFSIEQNLAGNPYIGDAIRRLKRYPVTIDEFIDSKEFLGDQVEVWPALRADVMAANPDVLTGERPIKQVLMGGATGTGKTEVSRMVLAYQTYLLTCFHEPQRLYGLPPSTTIVTMFISTQSGVTRRVLYLPFRHMFCGMPYTKRFVQWDRNREASLVLEGNIEIVPSLPSVQSMVGQAIISAMLDEVNFMTIVENSKQVAGARGKGGYFDQAELTFRTITRRRTGRFERKGRLSIGCICAISSTRYKGDFLDRRMTQVEENQKQGLELDVMTRRRKQYEVQPDIDWSNPFRLLVGNDNYGTRILKDHEEAGTHYPESAWVESVPRRYLADFIGDPEGSLRDVVGEATSAINPYITQRHKIVESMVRGDQRGLKPWVFKQNVDLETDGMPQVDESALPPRYERQKDWFVHVDLSRSKDRCGIAFVRVDGMMPYRNEKTGVVEQVPRLLCPLAVSIQPSKAMELDIAEVRQWVSLFHLHYGFNIAVVSYDGFQSAESIMLWRKAGIQSMVTTSDIGTEVYDLLKDALYHDRIDMITNEIVKDELANLELHEKTGKIDHPPKGTKDVSDAVACAAFNAARSRAVRSQMQATTETIQAREPVYDDEMDDETPVRRTTTTKRRNVVRR